MIVLELQVVLETTKENPLVFRDEENEWIF